METDKNEHLRKPGGPDVEPNTCSRLVGRGDLEKGVENLRSDSPTCDIEAQNMIFSFAATYLLVISLSISLTPTFKVKNKTG